MGKLTYNGAVSTEFDDRALSHLQMVMLAKLRRGESFSLSWRDHPSIGDGRTTIWVHPGASLVFKFFGGRPATINRAWIDLLTYAANSTSGLHLMREPANDPGSPADTTDAFSASSL